MYDVPTRHVPAGLSGTSVTLSVRFVPHWQDTTLAVGGVAGSTTAFWWLVDAPPAPCAHDVLRCCTMRSKASHLLRMSSQC